LDLLHCFDTLLNPRRYPPSQNALQEYAEPAIRTVVSHFTTVESDTTPLINAIALQRDALAVMTALRDYGGLQFATACEVLIQDFIEIYPEWAKLAKIACVIPVSSVPAERGFSLQNRLKNKQRSHLSEHKVTRLMRIASCGETLQTFNFLSAADSFNMAKKRKR